MDKQILKNKDIHRYLDGEMTDEETREFERLLENSPDLQQEAETMSIVGDALRRAMEDEVAEVDFRRVWPRVSAAIDEKEGAPAAGWIAFLRHILTPVRVAAVAAGIMVIGVTALLMWHLAVGPPSVEAAPTTVESIDYGGNPDIVISVETLEDSVTTVVTILEFDTDDSIVPE